MVKKIFLYIFHILFYIHYIIFEKYIFDKKEIRQNKIDEYKDL